MEAKESIIPNPCPWCGSETIKRGRVRCRYIRCTNRDCNVYGPNMLTDEEAIAAWNRVARPKEQTAQSRG